MRLGISSVAPIRQTLLMRIDKALLNLNYSTGCCRSTFFNSLDKKMMTGPILMRTASHNNRDVNLTLCENLDLLKNQNSHNNYVASCTPWSSSVDNTTMSSINAISFSLTGCLVSNFRITPLIVPLYSHSILSHERLKRNTKIISKRNLSTSVKPTHPIEQYLIKEPNSKSRASRHRNDVPLVILLPWLGSKAKHVEKYVDLYHTRGYDVITTGVTAHHFLWPVRTYPATAALCERLRCEDFCHRPLIFHSFSVGGYLLSVLFSQMIANPESYSDITKRIRGFVGDSLTMGSTGRVTNGIAQSVTQSKIGQLLIKGTLQTYYFLTTPWTIRMYDVFYDSFINYPVPMAPSLYFYSHNDPMCDSEFIAKIIQQQRDNGYTIYVKDWQVSGHTLHYVNYPEEYIAQLNQFLEVIDSENPTLKKSEH